MTTSLAAGERAAGDRLLGRAQDIGQAEMTRLLARTAGSARLYQRAARTLPFGVVSSFQKMQPYPDLRDPGPGQPHLGPGRHRVSRLPLRLRRHGGRATRIPASSRRSHQAARGGTHFAVTTESAVAFGEEICRRFNLEMLRFANSGTEATMDAIRVARAATGRDVVCKIEGSYHGHHDSVMFSDRAQRRPDGRPRPARQRPGLEGDGQGRGEIHPGGAVQRRRPSRARVPGARAGDRLPHHGARHDEHRHRGAAARVPRSGCASCAPGTASSSSSTRSRPASPSPRAAPPSGSACSPIWCASPRPSPADSRPRRSAGART